MKLEHMEVDLWPDPLLGAEMSLYQGADVGAHKAGIFLAAPAKGYQVWHNDVKSMYPSIMRMFNFSPETMRLVELKPYTGVYKLTPTLIEIPDDVLNKQLVIEIAEEDGVMRVEMDNLMNLRAKYRGEGADSAEKGMKLAANATYGYNGMRWARYGSFLVAIATAAIGRLIMKEIVKLGHKLADVTVLENDTDGVYTYGKEMLDAIKLLLLQMFKDFPKKYAIRVDNTKYFGMICTGKMKNYVLRKNHNNIIKGNSLKGRGMPGVCKAALEAIATTLFEVGSEHLEDAWFDIGSMIGDALLSEFEMSCEVGKNPDEYSDKSMYGRILKFAPWMQHGEELRYVRVTKASELGYHFMPLGSVPDTELLAALDMTYYTNRVKEAIKRLLLPIRDTDVHVDAFCKKHLDKKPKKKRKRKVKK